MNNGNQGGRCIEVISVTIGASEQLMKGCTDEG